jgi:hypothetical protein
VTDTQPMPDAAADLHATEHWFVRHGLPYFVPEEREAARSALHSRRTLVMLVLTALVALAGGAGLAWLVGDAAVAPTTLFFLVGIAVLGFGLTALRARPIAVWAVTRTLGSLRLLIPLVTRALPLLLLFITFLFINAEVWELSSNLDGAVLWMTVMLFALLAIGFLLVRLPEELDSSDRVVDEVNLVEACRRTPLETRARTMVAESGKERIEAEAMVRGYEKANLILVLVIAQAVQVLLLSLSVFVFFLVFGGIVMKDHVQEHWSNGPIHAMPLLSNLTVELVQVSVFLAAFSGFYFTICAVTDEAYRDQFFTTVKRELDRAVAVRAVYLALRGHDAA